MERVNQMGEIIKALTHNMQIRGLQPTAHIWFVNGIYGLLINSVWFGKNNKTVKKHRIFHFKRLIVTHSKWSELGIQNTRINCNNALIWIGLRQFFLSNLNSLLLPVWWGYLYINFHAVTSCLWFHPFTLSLKMSHRFASLFTVARTCTYDTSHSYFQVFKLI